MSNKMVECESCPTQVIEGKLNQVNTPHGKMLVCNACVGKHFSGIALTPKNTMQEKLEAKLDPKPVIAPTPEALQEISPVSNPSEVIEVKTKKKMTLEDLYLMHLQDETQVVEDLFKSNPPDLAYKLLEEGIQEYESISFEAKVRAAVRYNKKRGLDAASGKNRWDKERRGENKTNNSDPRNSSILKAEAKKKDTLTKVETVVQNFIQLGNSDEEILNMLSGSNKFKGSDVREAIQKFRS